MPVALEAELADGGGPEGEVAGVVRGELDPAGPEGAEDVAVGEEDRVASGLERVGDGSVASGADLSRGLALRDAVAPEVPARALLADLVGGQTFVGPVVVLAQVGFRLGAVAEAGELGGLPRAAARPSSVSGRSVEPVWRPETLHSVGPWRTRTITRPGSSAAADSGASSAARSRRACGCASPPRARGGTGWRGSRHAR